MAGRRYSIDHNEIAKTNFMVAFVIVQSIFAAAVVVVVVIVFVVVVVVVVVAVLLSILMNRTD